MTDQELKSLLDASRTSGVCEFGVLGGSQDDERGHAPQATGGVASASSMIHSGLRAKAPPIGGIRSGC